MDEKVVSVFDVAKYILHSIGGEISTMKLQKLCYYCQAWHLVNHGTPLFPEEFERWDNGPVCRDLFNEHKGWFVICNDREDAPNKLCGSVHLPTLAQEHIDRVLEDYGRFDGAQLSELIYGESPWKDTKRNQIIPMESMYSCYASLEMKPAAVSA